eukprot:6184700-Pleurochrysis_carterae.AAC.1
MHIQSLAGAHALTHRAQRCTDTKSHAQMLARPREHSSALTSPLSLSHAQRVAAPNLITFLDLRETLQDSHLSSLPFTPLPAPARCDAEHPVLRAGAAQALVKGEQDVQAEIKAIRRTVLSASN